ncbi:tRNA pseudouridine(55) synthase TruB [Saxibacter everestensis]|uniref:tRNA pseudouridine synthase B n=1 Tax=Saxibacter everestensis TaxID=2909229 RepID=A0ABY8QVQ6_9MICO|nr:tRNA pseudouridine(55) synthase TruB [Brevibacteriaceae bacterium ZFBP1038]
MGNTARDGDTTPAPTGILLVDKPQGWTSHDVVARARRLLGTKKVGHAGTLDPMATGLLLLGVGKGTRLLTYLVGEDKTYSAVIRLGSSTPTDDADSTADAFADPTRLGGITDDDIRAGISALTGDIQQVPSAVSAIKVDGVRSYQRVRAGEDVVLKPRPVLIRRFELLDVQREVGAIDLSVTVECTSGTYVRALARDLGNGLGVGGHLTALRRTLVGRFSVNEALELPGWDEPAETPALMSLAEVARKCLAVRDLSDDDVRALGYGQWIAESSNPGPVACIGQQGDLVAIVENIRGKAKPVVVFS